jgi:hypothetical protein
LQADRRLIVVLLSLSFFSSFVLAGLLAPGSINSIIESSDPIETLFQGLVGAIITGVTLVLTINQLVLSQELGGLADQRERMKGAMDFFEDVESLIDTPVTSLDPSKFLCCLLEEIVKRSETLEDQSTSFSDDSLADLLENVRDEAEQAIDKLENSSFGTFNVISAALNFNYSFYLNEFRSLKANMSDTSEASSEQMNELIQLLEAFGPAREHIKTLYFQWDLIELSKVIIYTGIPALLISSGTVLFLTNPGLIPGKTLGISNILLTISLLATLSLTPFFVLVSYVLRVATVARRTLAIGSLILTD